MAKKMKDRGPLDLRIASHSREKAVREAAKRELRRRVGILSGDGLIPAWELELRGPDPGRWEVE